MVPLRVKGSEIFKLIQYTVQLLGVEGKGLMLLLVLVKAWPRDKEKVWNALIATSGIRVFAEYRQEDVSYVEALTIF